jgi:hypothetical protein
LPIANLSQNLPQINIQKVICDPQLKTMSYCDQFSRCYAQAEVKLGWSEMSLGELDKRDADLGPTSRFGSARALDGYHGEPGRPGDVEVVRTLLDEVSGMGQLIEPCLVEVGARNEREPSVTAFVLLAQMPLSIHAFPRRGFVSADVFTCPDHLDDERIRGP